MLFAYVSTHHLTSGGSSKPSAAGLASLAVASGVRALMKIVVALLMGTVMLLTPRPSFSSESGCASSAPAYLHACLQDRLDRKLTTLNRALERAISRSRELASGAPDAKIDVAAVVSSLNDAQVQWLSFATSECDAERGLVGNGTDRNSVDALCLIRLYDQRIQALNSLGEI